MLQKWHDQDLLCTSIHKTQMCSSWLFAGCQSLAAKQHWSDHGQRRAPSQGYTKTHLWDCWSRIREWTNYHLPLVRGWSTYDEHTCRQTLVSGPCAAPYHTRPIDTWVADRKWQASASTEQGTTSTRCGSAAC